MVLANALADNRAKGVRTRTGRGPIPLGRKRRRSVRLPLHKGLIQRRWHEKVTVTESGLRAKRLRVRAKWRADNSAKGVRAYTGQVLIV